MTYFILIIEAVVIVVYGPRTWVPQSDPFWHLRTC